ncbi:MAG: twin-arginine translocase TatA/TatE family subunit [Chthoniobacterales bacterium]
MNNLAFISNLAGPDGFLICFFVLIFFGAKRLPELARSMGGAVREFNKAKEEFANQLTSPPAAQPMAAPRQELMPATPAPVEKVAGESTPS